MSEPSLTKNSCSSTINSIYKSPFGPPFAPGCPLPLSLCLSPVFTPDGILIVIFLVFVSFPLPLHSLHFLLYVLLQSIGGYLWTF